MTVTTRRLAAALFTTALVAGAVPALAQTATENSRQTTISPNQATPPAASGNVSERGTGMSSGMSSGMTHHTTKRHRTTHHAKKTTSSTAG